MSEVMRDVTPQASSVASPAAELGENFACPFLDSHIYTISNFLLLSFACMFVDDDSRVSRRGRSVHERKNVDVDVPGRRAQQLTTMRLQGAR